MNEFFKIFNEKLLNENVYDFEILNFSKDGTLTIVGSFDFAYYHLVEIYFKEVTYISCPTSFNFATFRLATEDERSYVKKTVGMEGNIICIVLHEDIPKWCVKHFVIAKEIQYKFGPVFYYKRENLQEGERIADWIK